MIERSVNPRLAAETRALQTVVDNFPHEVALIRSKPFYASSPFDYCLYCNRHYTDSSHFPYCGTVCAIDAEKG